MPQTSSTSADQAERDLVRAAIDVTLATPSPTARQLTDVAVRVRRSVDRAESIIEALLTLAVSDQGKLSTEFTDLATWAEDAIDAAVVIPRCLAADQVRA